MVLRIPKEIKEKIAIVAPHVLPTDNGPEFINATDEIKQMYKEINDWFAEAENIMSDYSKNHDA